MSVQNLGDFKMDGNMMTKFKLKCVLLELLKSDYKVTDDTILEKLISHLSDKATGSQIIDVPLCVAWSRSVVLSWNQGQTSSSVVCFALRLSAIIVEDENNFISIQKAVSPEIPGIECLGHSNTTCVFLQLLRDVCLSTTKSAANFSVKCALVQFLSSLLKHSSGRQWLMNTGLWKEVHEMTLGDSSIYVVREGRRFLSALLNNMVSLQEAEPVLACILEPFLSMTLVPELPLDTPRVIASLYLISDILDSSFLTSDPKTNVIKSLVAQLVCNPTSTIIPKCLEVLKQTKSEEMEELLAKIAVFMYILDTVKDGQKHQPLEIKAICIKILDVFSELINKGSVENVLKLCVLCHNQWAYVARIQRKDEDTTCVLAGDAKQYRFEDQLLCLQLSPIFCCLLTVPSENDKELYLYKLFYKICFESQRLVFSFRNMVLKLEQLHIWLAMSARYVMHLAHVLSLERAVLVFQSFIYVLKHFVLCAESETKQGGWGGEFRQSHHSTLLVAILDGLANLVRTHRITWRESVESLCLLTLAQELLDNPAFSSKVGLVVQALHLIQLCIENFMPPNLALLTNSLSGTSFDQLGTLIFKRLHDPHWEVRDSSLEVLITLATISNSKYPLFQDLILDNKLCEVVVHLALNDAESYVCASATKCLTAMVRVDRLWNEELMDKDLVNKMIGLLNGESEGVLRREASLLLCEVFKHRKVQSDLLHKMCITMANVVLSDLHWEVKVNALNFWQLIIDHRMNDQGMIDGVFPQVTFSKEHRKIINLTPAAIQERLRKVLVELSQNGCLHVLLETIQKDEDLEVVKKASQIITSLSGVLERHGLLEPKNVSAPSPTSSEAPPASNLNHLSSPSNQSNYTSESPNSLCEKDITSTSIGDFNTNFDSAKSQDFNSFQNSDKPAKSILDLDPQGMGFAVLDEELGLDFPNMTPADQDQVIDSILNDRDINLLAKVYLGTGTELPGRQGPETKISKPIRPLVILNSDEFLRQLVTLQVDELVKERTRWIKDTEGNLETLLDDMLIARAIPCEGEDDCNAMDCY
ncbi:uncharacterized protein LOC117650022 isoform X2 [Thrips palmi]|uniref:Uncharacterized protein LOC117650022 isoform X2 n=1 Tax=Thrips palmi TaxID=161013 RepID=A0A6P8ZV25_THRPL|nr:uncharacterized protein LOC117650022 isoform X2 [Thrips palmi]